MKKSMILEKRHIKSIYSVWRRVLSWSDIIMEYRKEAHNRHQLNMSYSSFQNSVINARIFEETAEPVWSPFKKYLIYLADSNLVLSHCFALLCYLSYAISSVFDIKKNKSLKVITCTYRVCLSVGVHLWDWNWCYFISLFSWKNIV